MLAARFGWEVGGTPKLPLHPSHVFTSWGEEEEEGEFPAPVPAEKD